ncbi:MAG: hypothetical protein HY270_22835 [Deltaproteobacteria bacterium]|nr:hypothetical protein [Deltaproteobacteria bacterium]
MQQTAIREELEVNVLLRVSAAQLLVWALVLGPLRSYLLPESESGPLSAALSNGWACANLTCAYMFWRSARLPQPPRAVVYGATLMAVFKTAGDLHGLLFLPPNLALLSVGDLVFSVALFVGLLREMPRFLEIDARDAAKEN